MRLARRLEVHLQGQLHLPRNVGLTGDLAEETRSHAGVRRAELHVVERIQRFQAKLGSHSLSYPIDGKTLEQEEGGVLLDGPVDPG
jgi:hypothetical protein